MRSFRLSSWSLDASLVLELINQIHKLALLAQSHEQLDYQW